MTAPIGNMPATRKTRRLDKIANDLACDPLSCLQSDSIMPLASALLGHLARYDQVPLLEIRQVHLALAPGGAQSPCCIDRECGSSGNETGDYGVRGAPSYLPLI